MGIGDMPNSSPLRDDPIGTLSGGTSELEVGLCGLCSAFSLFFFPKILPIFFKWPIFLFMLPMFLVSYHNTFHFNSTLPNAQKFKAL